jgi:hypothetical protein
LDKLSNNTFNAKAQKLKMHNDIIESRTVKALLRNILQNVWTNQKIIYQVNLNHIGKIVSLSQRSLHNIRLF